MARHAIVVALPPTESDPVCAELAMAGFEATSRFAHVRQLLLEAMPNASVSFGLAELGADEPVLEAIARADAEMYASRRVAREMRVSPDRARDTVEAATLTARATSRSVTGVAPRRRDCRRPLRGLDRAMTRRV